MDVMLQGKIKSWAIYYDNKVVSKGTTLDEWCNRENDGVQAVALFYEDAKPEVFSGKELYIMYEGRHGLTFVPSKEKPSPFQELCDIDGIKIGKLMEAHDFYDIVKKARVDTYGS